MIIIIIIIINNNSVVCLPAYSFHPLSLSLA